MACVHEMSVGIWPDPLLLSYEALAIEINSRMLEQQLVHHS